MGTPAGTMITDGYPTRIDFAADADVNLWEKVVQPPGMDGGGAINITTMLNATYRTSAPKSLISMTESSFTAGYDPAVYDDIIALINVNGLITITFSDTSTLAFYGFLNLFEPNDHEEGEHPEAEVTIVPTLQNAGTETAPVFTTD